jgi:cytochrome b
MVTALLLGLAALHVAGVVVAEVREGGSVVSARFSGRKTLDRPLVDGPIGH